MAEGFPDQVAVSSPTPEPSGTTEAVLGEVLDDGQGRGRLVEEVEDQAHRVTDLLVRVEDDPALGVVDQSRGRSEPELALAGLVQLASQHSATEPVQFGLAHGAQESQEEPVGIRGGVIDSILVDDQRAGQSTDLNETIPVAAGACQARRFQAEYGPGPAQADLGDEVLKAVTTDRGRPRASLILVDDLDALGGPSQIASATGEVVLPGGAAGVLADLQRSGLADVDQCESVEVVRSDLRGDGECRHRSDSCGSRVIETESPRDWTPDVRGVG